MLSKSQFSAAVKRLQSKVNMSHLTAMIRKSMERSDIDSKSIKEALKDIENSMPYATPLDRRRAENYLSNALYGKNHSQVAHFLVNDKKTITTEELAKRYELYGSLLYCLDPSSFGFMESNLADQIREQWTKKLKETPITDFQISYFNFDNYKSNHDDSLRIIHGVVYINFADISIHAEMMYYRNFIGEYDKYPRSPIYDIRINGLPIKDYLKTIDKTSSCFDSHDLALVLFSFISEYLDRAGGFEGTCDFLSEQAGINKDNYNFLLGHIYEGDYAKYALKDSDIWHNTLKIVNSLNDKEIEFDKDILGEPKYEMTFKKPRRSLSNTLGPSERDVFIEISGADINATICIEYLFYRHSDTGHLYNIEITMGNYIAFATTTVPEGMYDGVSKDASKIAETIFKLNHFIQHAIE